MATLNFDATSVEPQKDFEPLPVGDYVAAIVESESKPNRRGTGSFLSLTIEILEGDHKGRRLWTNLNLDNPSSVAVEIAKAELSAICHAVDVMQPRDSQELHNRPMLVTVKMEKRKDTGELQNAIKKYQPATAAAQPAATAGANAPW